MPNSFTIGLVGGIASGKSLVASQLAEQGAVVLDADAAVHALFQEDSVRSALRERWGDAVIAADGTVDRTHLAQLAFGTDPSAVENRRFLEELLHPRVRQRLLDERAEAAGRGARVFVLDVPLLLEVGWESLCDVVVMVDAPRAVRLERVEARGWTEAEFDQRESAQMAVDEKRRRADVVLQNDGDVSQLLQQVEGFWQTSVPQHARHQG